MLDHQLENILNNLNTSSRGDPTVHRRTHGQTLFHLVPTKGGMWTPCGDYRQLNAAMKQDRYLMRYILYIVANLRRKNSFFKSWLVERLFPNTSGTRRYLKGWDHTNLYKFTVITFRLKNVVQWFQRSIDKVLRSLNFCSCYVGDFLMASN